LKNDEYEDRLKELKLWTLGNRSMRADLIEVFKITHSLSSLSLDTFFVLDTDSQTRGQGHWQGCHSIDHMQFHIIS